MSEVVVLVLDEADLLFGFGHEKLLREFIQFLPGTQQTLLMSATLTEQVTMIKKLTMKKHVTLKLADSSLPNKNELQQYQICLNEDFDKYLVALSFLKEMIISIYFSIAYYMIEYYMVTDPTLVFYFRSYFTPRGFSISQIQDK